MGQLNECIVLYYKEKIVYTYAHVYVVMCICVRMNKDQCMCK